VNRAIALDPDSGDFSVASTLGSAPSWCNVEDVNGYWRISFPAANNSSGHSSLRLAVYPAYAAALAGTGLGVNTPAGSNQRDSAVFWGAQLEKRAIASAYLQTETHARRESDLLTAENVSGWYDGQAGTVSAAVVLPPLGSEAAALSFGDGSVNNRIGPSWAGGQASLELVTNGVLQQPPVLSVALAGKVRLAGAYASNDLQVAVDGLVGNGSGLAAIPAVDRLQLGKSGNVFLNGHFQGFLYFPARLPDFLLEELSQ
jgi:hypothetical protein